MIIDVWSATINQEKETEAVNFWKRGAQLENQILGTNYRVMRYDSEGNMAKILMMDEIESPEAVEENTRTLISSRKWEALNEEAQEKKYTGDIEHHYYTIIEYRQIEGPISKGVACFFVVKFQGAVS